MKKEIAEKIREEAEKIAIKFSDKERGFNFAQETFTLMQTIVLSEYSVVAIYKKKPTDKVVAFYIQFINTGNSKGGFVTSFCIKYQHIEDFEVIKGIMRKIENHNFKCNFGG